MERMKVTDELLRDVFSKLSDELIGEWENIPDTDHKLSDEFKKKMKKLTDKTKNKQLFKELISIGKVAAALAIVIGAVFFGSTLTAKADPHLWFKKMEVILNDSSMYVYDEETDKYYLTLYEPTYVPEGYEEVERIVDYRGIRIIYENSENKKIKWKQNVINDTSILGVDSEYDAEIETEYKGENIILYVYDDGCKTLYYETMNCTFKLNAHDITIVDMYKMIRDMKEVE